MNNAFINGYYKEASRLFGTFYSFALKGNSALKKACLMGIVEVRDAVILSGLNNIRVYCSVPQKYSSYFGFTKEEIVPLVEASNLNIDKVMKEYNFP
jgi:hypothetical protein